jgi:SAM-dependent methyltransferase
MLGFEFPPEYALALFCLLGSVYWSVCGTRVPLYLSSPAAAQALADLLPRDRSFAFLDLGCGLGGVLAHLDRARPSGTYHGAELAPVPFLLCWLRTALSGRRCSVSWEDFRNLDFGRYDVIYAYLSPAAMGGLWEKAAREMRPGSMLVSNSFAVPGVQPAFTLATGAGSGSRLLVWRM